MVDESEARVSIDPSDLIETNYRGSGKGGQHRNKTDSAVRLLHVPSGVVKCSEAERSQWQNRQRALAALEAALLAEETARLQADTNASRRAQVVSDRSAKSFTHNEQRDEVLRHDDKKRWRTRDFARGKL